MPIITIMPASARTSIRVSARKPGLLTTPRRLALTLCMLCAGGTAHAAGHLAELSFEQLLDVEISGASRFVQPSREAPSAATVITREQIRDHGWRTLAELLDAVPGLFMASDRVYSFAGIHGFQQPGDYNTKFKLLLDGIPLNDPAYGQAQIGEDGPVDLALLERVEFIPGPGSSAYGSNAFLGVINLVTTSARPMQGTTLDTAFADQRGRSIALRHGHASDRHELLVSVSAWRSDGDDITLSDIGSARYGAASGVEAPRGHRLTLRHAWDEFALTFTHASRRKGYAGAPYDTVFGDPRTRATEALWTLGLNHRHEWLPGLTLATRLDLGGTEYRGDWAYDTELGRDETTTRWWGAELQATDIRFASHTLLYGAEYRAHPVLRQRNRTLGAQDQILLDDRRSNHQAGLYVQDEWRSDNWLLNTGLRLDHYSSFGTSLNPRLGLIQLLGPSTALKYLFGTAYRAPSPYEQHYHDGELTMKANPALDPERIRSFEIVLEHSDAHGWDWNGSLFHKRITDLIVQEADPADGLLVYRNRGKAELRGAMLSTQTRWEDGTRFAASWSWQQARDPDTGSRLLHAPRHVAKADLTLPLSAHWHATLEGRFVSARKTAASEVGSQFWANAAIVSVRPVLTGAQLRMRIDNLFDRSLHDPVSEEFGHEALPRPGRKLELGLTWAF